MPVPTFFSSSGLDLLNKTNRQTIFQKFPCNTHPFPTTYLKMMSVSNNYLKLGNSGISWKVDLSVTFQLWWAGKAVLRPSKVK